MKKLDGARLGGSVLRVEYAKDRRDRDRDRDRYGPRGGR